MKFQIDLGLMLAFKSLLIDLYKVLYFRAITNDADSNVIYLKGDTDSAGIAHNPDPFLQCLPPPLRTH